MCDYNSLYCDPHISGGCMFVGCSDGLNGHAQSRCGGKWMSSAAGAIEFIMVIQTKVFWQGLVLRCGNSV